ncbi:hypothetical protein ACFOWM_13500 [Ferruginibacter yonginensis]|uniref:HEPN AbiU2-like domain-containing protein n=1 Tax=Ferruginibacter yonginensis TaxID=1310416 RepID=A0ABV8QW41_9BACT
MRNIDFLVEQDNINSKIWIIHILNNPENINKMALNFRFLEVSHAIKCIADENFQQSKQHFYTASLLDQLRIEQFNGDVLSYDVKSVCNPILSDNEELVKRFSKLRYHAWGKMPGMDENVLKGKNDVWANTVQFFMMNDVEKIERNLNIIETITIKKLPKNQQELLIDFDFFKALYLGDKSKMEEALDNLVSPKIHKKKI